MQVTPSGSESWTVPLERLEVMLEEIASKASFNPEKSLAE